MPKLIVVVGATGQQGGSVVNWLLKAPEGTFTIRGVTRKPDSDAAKALVARGVEVVKADLAVLSEVVAAFAGAWGVFGMTQFYEHGYDAEVAHGTNIVEAAKTAKIQHLVWATVDGQEGQCQAVSWKSKAVIEDQIVASGVPWTFVHIPMYYENFWTSFFAPAYDAEKGFNWNVFFLPDVPIFAFSIADFGAFVAPAFEKPEEFSGKRIKIVVEYLTLRDLADQFNEVTGEKASLGAEYTREQLDASKDSDNPLLQAMYWSWEFVLRAGPESGVRDKAQTLTIYPGAKTYREWVKDSPLVKDLVDKFKATAA